jgi:hypothetical protein
LLRNAIETAGKLDKARKVVASVIGNRKETTQIGYDFSKLNEEEQLKTLNDIVDASKQSGIPIELELGPGPSYIGCKEGVTCLKVDMRDIYSDHYVTDSPIEGNSFTGMFKLNLHKLKDTNRGKLNHIFTVSPLPVDDMNTDNPFAINNLAATSAELLEPGGELVIIFNPCFNQGNYNNPTGVTTENLYIAAVNALFGKGEIHYSNYEDLKNKYPDIILEPDRIQSEFIGPKNIEEVMVLVFKKSAK